MSSFPILRLPGLALENVFVFGNPYEIYQFSKLSERNKKIAKLHCYKKFLLTSLEYEGKQSLLYKCDEYCSEDFRFKEIPLKTARCFTGKSMIEEAFDMIQGMKYLFGHPLEFISINVDDGLSTGQLNSLISRINSINQEYINSIDFITESMENLEFFLQNYKKPAKSIYIKLSSDHQANPTPSWFKESKQPEAVHIQCESLCVTRWGSIEQLLAFDFVYASFFCNLTSEDLNVFLKSWQTRKTHLNMKRFTIDNKTNENFNMNTVLDGLSPIIEYPRIIGDNKGQCKIQRSDGKVGIL